jgi:hypothetical protein
MKSASPVEHGSLLKRVVVGRESRDGWQDPGESVPVRRDGDVAEGAGDEGAGLVGLETFRCNEVFEFLCLRFSTKRRQSG